MNRRSLLKSGAALGALTGLMNTAPFLSSAAMARDEFSNLDGMAQAELVRSGQVSPLELVEAAIKRIEKMNPIVNAVVHKNFDAARDAAREGETGPLPNGPFRGVPYLIKDLSDVAGLPTSFGSELFANNIANADNGSVIRAKRAGLIILGKTNTPEFGFTSTTEPNLTGAARNPWNAAYQTGGSSGGAAAAVASGMVPFAHASDGGGSIRIPASVCGLVGLKPSRNRLYVLEPIMSSADITVRLAVSRSVRDTAQILNVSEFKAADDHKVHDPVGFVGTASKRRLRIAFSTRNYLGKEPHPDVRAAIENTAKLCADLGHIVEPVDAPVLGAEFMEHFMNNWASMAADLVNNAWLLGLTQARIVSAEKVFEPWTLGLAEFYQRNLEKDDQIIPKALAYFDRVAEQYATFFKSYDVQLTPVLSRPPFLIGEQDINQAFETHLATVLDYVSYTPQHNAAGIPAITLPLYTSRKGLPIGSLFGAKYGDERTLLELAYELEQAKPWANRWPEISDVNL